MNFLMQWFKLFTLNIIGAVRRAFCCFSRRRKPSFGSETLSQNIDVVIINSTNTGQNTRTQHNNSERDWNSWDDSPRTVDEHIEQYRQRLARPPTPSETAPEPDFFKELTPVIKPQPKYFLGSQEEEKVNFSHLEAKTDVPIALNAELEDWEDDNAIGGWEELDSEQAKQMIRDKRREMRYQRQKELKPQGIAVQSTYGIATDHSRPHT